MKTLFLIAAAVMFGGCLHQANIISTCAPRRMQLALIAMMAGDLILVLSVLSSRPAWYELVAGALVLLGAGLWLCFERRICAARKRAPVRD